MMSSFRPTPRTRLKRLPDRGSYDRQVIHAILDEAIVCHVGIVADDQPFVLPMAFARRDESLLLHGSAASRILRRLAGGARACVTVTLLDGLVLARSAFHHSMNYRSVMALGTATPIEDDSRKKEALELLVEHLVPGRKEDARGPSPHELKATTVLDFPLEEVSAKIRIGPPKDEPDDMAMPIWAGVVPFDLAIGEPVPDPAMPVETAPPDYVTGYRRPTRRG